MSPARPPEFYTTPCPDDLACEWCCHPFEGVPVGMPVHMSSYKVNCLEGHTPSRKPVEDPRLPATHNVVDLPPLGKRPEERTGYNFRLTGAFCSWACCKAFSTYEVRGVHAGERGSLISFLAKKLNRGVPVPISCAPPRRCLKMFGGEMDIAEFRGEGGTFFHESNPLLHLSSNEDRILRLVSEKPFQPSRRARKTAAATPKAAKPPPKCAQRAPTPPAPRRIVIPDRRADRKRRNLLHNMDITVVQPQSNLAPPNRKRARKKKK